MIKNLNVKKIELANPEQVKIAIVQSTYHSELNENMVEYCKEVLLANRVCEENISIYFSPGTWEIPLIARKIANTEKYNAIVTFGIIIKGDTYHFDMIANESARSLMETSTKFCIPIGFEILAVNNMQQAIDRASQNEFNKGIEAGNAILLALKTLQEIN